MAENHINITTLILASTVVLVCGKTRPAISLSSPVSAGNGGQTFGSDGTSGLTSEKQGLNDGQYYTNQGSAGNLQLQLL